jgi:hypothetical protein
MLYCEAVAIVREVKGQQRVAIFHNLPCNDAMLNQPYASTNRCQVLSGTNVATAAKEVIMSVINV